MIFALPSLRLLFKTEHLQGVCTPDASAADKPSVQCSFITEFEDHIFVTVDADAFFFLHDLITSYVKEKEKVVSAINIVCSKRIKTDHFFPFQSFQQNMRASSPNPAHSQTSASSSPDLKKPEANGNANAANNHNTSNDAFNANSHKKSSESLHSMLNTKNLNVKLDKGDLELFMRDWRNFECKTWHLEPTVRLLSWAGKSIEPYGIDYILHKLGFSHARTTIPKWLQRGFMDPLDNLEALLMIQLLSLVKADSAHASDKQKQ